MPWSFFDSNGNQLTKQRGTLAIADGGTGGITAAAALTALGVGTGDSPTFTAVTVPTITGASTITLDATTDIVLDADGGDVFFKDGGTTFGSATNTSGNLIIKSGTTTALTFAGANVTAAGTIGSGAITSTGAIIGTQVDILAQGDLRLQDTSGNQYVAFEANGTTTTHTLTFPAAQGASGSHLQNNGSGALTWVVPAAGVGLGLVIALGG